jgi:lysophospholipase L1-like esterase
VARAGGAPSRRGPTRSSKRRCGEIPTGRPIAAATARRRARVGRGEILLAAGALSCLLLFALAGEFAVRVFLDLNFLGNSRDLFVASAYGPSKGNAPSAQAISFGAVVHTDEHGFRVPRGGLPDDASKAEAILILGDSVGFGPAVEEPQTFAGLLRARFPEKRVYNSSVIGYATPDYKNVVEAFLPLHREVTQVVLVYCLNDTSSQSAEAIDRYLEAPREKAPEPDLRQMLQGLGPLRSVNDFLRSRSKLYLWIKHQAMAPRRRGWEEMLRLYEDGDQGRLEGAARDIAEIAARLARDGIRFVAVLAPFEHQIRNPDDPSAQLPQQKLGALLSRAQVETVDARPAFDRGDGAPDYFLPYDAMHFSREGHRVMAEVIARALGADREEPAELRR